ncbi:MAG: hypothetical protein SFX73_15005 [Kofleriaceae bacterium]|nr:hypothetical protein [Kofleriaceae bacterium]
MTDLAIGEVDARARRECVLHGLDEPAWRQHLETLVTASNASTLHAGDLLLAFACATGDAVALQMFEERYATMLAEALRAADPNPGAIDDAVQELRRRLLVADVDGARPRILGYSGTGPLGAWLRVAALRIAIDHKRSGWREVPVEDAMVPEPSAMGGTGGFAREHDLAIIRAALRAAIAAQPSRTRALLRYYYSENVGVEELGTMYRVHFSTISRWLERARAEIFAETRRQLAEKLGAAPSEIESHLGLVHSLEVSLGSLLETPAPRP